MTSTSSSNKNNMDYNINNLCSAYLEELIDKEHDFLRNGPICANPLCNCPITSHLRSPATLPQGNMHEYIDQIVERQFKRQSTHKGTSTYAEIFQEISFDTTTVDWDLLYPKDNDNRWFTFMSQSEPSLCCIPPMDCKKITKSETQSFVTDCLRKIYAIRHKHYFQLNSGDQSPLAANFHYSTDFEAYKQPSFLNSKPSVVFHLDNTKGEITIVYFGDVKSRAEGDFTDEQKGQLLDMATEFMLKVQITRSHLYCFLTDGWRFQFFRVNRVDNNDNLTFSQSVVLTDQRGWQAFMTLLEKDPKFHGYIPIEVPGWDVTKILGRGGQATVYAGSNRDHPSCVVKIFADISAMQAEISALKALTGLQNVPAVVDTVADSMNRILVLSPLAVPVVPLKDGQRINGAHCVQLLDVIEFAHGKRLCHRDIKPGNIFIYENRLILSDWASSCGLDGKHIRWQGTLCYSDASPHHNGSHIASTHADCRSAVRSMYSMICNVNPVGESNLDSNWVYPSQWLELMELANNSDYDGMRAMCCKL